MAEAPLQRPVQIAAVERVEQGRGGVLFLLTGLDFAAVPSEGLGGGDGEVLGILGAEVVPRLLHLLRRERLMAAEAVELAGEELGEAHPVLCRTVIRRGIPHPR